MGENRAIKKIIKASIERMLDAELTENLGYENTHPPERIQATAVTVKHTRLLKMITEKLS
jgi:transposase-like protein